MEKLVRLRIFLHDYYRPFYRVMAFVFLCLLVTEGLNLVSPYFYGQIIDAMYKHLPFQTVLFFIGIAALAKVGNRIVAYVREHVEHIRIHYDTPRHVSATSLHRLFKVSVGQHLSGNSGLKRSTLEHGELAMRTLMYNLIYSFVPLVIQVIATLIALAYFSMLTALVVLAFVVVYSLMSWHIMSCAYPELRKFQDALREEDKRHTEILRNAALIKTSAKEEEIVDEYTERHNAVDSIGKKIWTILLMKFYGREAFTDLAQYSTYLFVACLVYFYAAATVASFVTITIWTNALFAQLWRMSTLQRQFLDDLSKIGNAADMLMQEPAVVDPVSPTPLPYVRGEIEFHCVCFHYPKHGGASAVADRPVLTDVSFTIAAGETVALVGHSGAGKTTIVHLLMRGYDPDSGQITIDGHDLRTLSGIEFRRHIGYVEQSVELFDETLRYNLLFGVPRALHAEAEKRLEEVARKAGIDKFYDRLGSLRFDTEIGEKGVKLSGGERQRVGIARALLKNPSILIFDEATSALDAENEALIQEAMKEALQGRTGIVIAHRLSTIRNADKIIMLERGCVAGIGTHSELMGKCLNYHSLVMKQMIK